MSDEYITIPTEDIFAESTRASIADDFQKGVKEQDEQRERCDNYKYAGCCSVLVVGVIVAVIILCRVFLKL